MKMLRRLLPLDFVRTSKCYQIRQFSRPSIRFSQIAQPVEEPRAETPIVITRTNKSEIEELIPTASAIHYNDPVVLPFDAMPGPKSLKYFSNLRQYLSQLGTQITAGALRFTINMETLIYTRGKKSNISALFDQYGPVVRFVSPVGGDIVLINKPDHIQKVYSAEGDYPVRSALDSLDSFRQENFTRYYRGLYNVRGEDWSKRRSVIYAPLQNAITDHINDINNTCGLFCEKLYGLRNLQDEIPKNLYIELQKWAFDCMGLIIFAKNFGVLGTNTVCSQKDGSWLFHSLEKASNAIGRCESGTQLWKIFATPSWMMLNKHCNNLDSLIGKYVAEAEKYLNDASQTERQDKQSQNNSLIMSMLLANEKFSAEDISTVLMDMLILGVNTVTSTLSFLLYNLARHYKCQMALRSEIDCVLPTVDVPNLRDLKQFKEKTPYLQACIKETLRLVPPIPMVSRILPKNITLDNFNIPRGTLVLMSLQHAAHKEMNFDDATSFRPERWLSPDSVNYHGFAAIPFGYGARKCLGQNMAEIMISLLTMKIIEKFKIEYHYGDISPTKTFISKPDRQLKLRFIDRN